MFLCELRRRTKFFKIDGKLFFLLNLGVKFKTDTGIGFLMKADRICRLRVCFISSRCESLIGCRRVSSSVKFI